MIPVLHERWAAHLVLVGVMTTHHRLRADRADRRTTASGSRSAIALTIVLALLAGACGPESAVESTLGAAASTQVDEVVAETIDAPAVVGDSADGGDDEPDYTAAELEVLLEAAATGDEVRKPPSPEPLESRSPKAAVEAIETEIDGATTDGNGTPILDRVQPIDGAPSGTVFGIRDGRRINEAGEANRLDEPAALACGNVELALTDIDEGRPDQAADHLKLASTMAADSLVPAMDAWFPILDEAASRVAASDLSSGNMSALLAFLSTCTQGGYEL